LTCTECCTPFGEIASFANCDGILKNVFTTNQDFKYKRTAGAEGLLYVPSQEFERIIVKCAQVFRFGFDKIQTQNHIVCKFVEIIVSLGILKESDGNFCYVHLFKAIKLAFQLAITNYVRCFNDKYCDSSGKMEKFRKFTFR
jgi:hypothetical protein